MSAAVISSQHMTAVLYFVIECTYQSFCFRGPWPDLTRKGLDVTGTSVNASDSSMYMAVRSQHSPNRLAIEHTSWELIKGRRTALRRRDVKQRQKHRGRDPHRRVR